MHNPTTKGASSLPASPGLQAAAAASARSTAAAAAASGPPAWRFRVVSYNVLADCLAHEHAAELYASAPRYSLEWGYRCDLILRCSSSCGYVRMGGGCRASFGCTRCLLMLLLSPSVCREVLHHRPDVMCLQEVDHFRQFQQALQRHG